jgi:hypothetical protein
VLPSRRLEFQARSIDSLLRIGLASRLWFTQRASELVSQRTFGARVDRRRDFAGIQTELRRDHIAICAGHPRRRRLSLNERLRFMSSEAGVHVNVTTSRLSRRKLSGARPPVRAGLSYPDGRGRLGLPSGLHPGATPEAPGVQKCLILRGFLDAILLWRRGRESR